jgi:hypothetical protein
MLLLRIAVIQSENPAGVLDQLKEKFAGFLPAAESAGGEMGQDARNLVYNHEVKGRHRAETVRPKLEQTVNLNDDVRKELPVLQGRKTPLPVRAVPTLVLKVRFKIEVVAETRKVLLQILCLGYTVRDEKDCRRTPMVSTIELVVDEMAGEAGFVGTDNGANGEQGKFRDPVSSQRGPRPKPPVERAVECWRTLKDGTTCSISLCKKAWHQSNLDP